MIIESKHTIQASNIYAGCVAEFENIWPDHKEVVETIENELIKEESFMNVYWERAKVGENSNAEIRTNTIFPLAYLSTVNETCNKLNNRFYTDAYAAVTWYRNHFGIEQEIYENEKEGLDLLRYQTGQKYGAHYDDSGKPNRSVSPILYLNNDYEGGELEFVHHKVKIKPKAGTLYLFPANYAYAHIAHPVTKGTKYAMVTFFHDQEN